MFGEVYYWSYSQRCGTIRADNGQKYFVHASDLTPACGENLSRYERVYFEAEESSGKPRAVSVMRVNVDRHIMY
jgi:cold shock CspA family protein